MKARLANTLGNRKGEMLIETIISIMLFVVLMATVTTIITSATRGLRSTQREAENVQDTANNMVIRSATLTPQVKDITVTLENSALADPDATSVEVTQEAQLTSDEGMLYFYVESTTPTPP